MNGDESGGRRWEWPTDLLPYAADLAGLLAASVEDDGILGYATRPSQAETRAFVDGLVAMAKDGTGCTLIGSDEAGIVAMCVVATNSMPNCRHIAEVSKAYLLPRVRRSLALLELVQAVCVKTRELEIEMLTIDVREGSHAHRVWDHLGFTTYGVLSDYSRIGGQKFRGHYMSHTVSELESVAAAKLASRGQG
jgi:hypothetical protein